MIKKYYPYKKNKIIYKIIKSFIKYYQKINVSKTKKNPLFILDHFDGTYIKKLIELQQKYDFYLIFVYDLKYKVSNELLLNNILNTKKDNIYKRYIICNKLFDRIKYLPINYPTYFRPMIQSITSYLKMKTCINEEEAKNLKEIEEKKIKEEILYSYDNCLKTLYLFLLDILSIIGYEIDMKIPYYQHLFLKMPLNFFDIYILNDNKIKICYSSESIKLITEELCNSSCIISLDRLSYLHTDNFIKCGFFEKCIINLIREINPIFGQIKQEIKFDCLLNRFKTKKDYSFNENELSNKFKKLRSIKNLKKEFQNFILNTNIGK